MLIHELLERLGFEVGDQDHAFGEIVGNPVSLTILGADPLALLLAFKTVYPHARGMDLPAEIAVLVESGRAEVSFEAGITWLSLDDLSGESADSTRHLLESFGQALSAAGLSFPPGCVSCGCQDDARLLYAEGRCSRLCPRCAENLLQQSKQAEQRLNKASIWHLLGSPLACLYVSGIWLVAWLSLDALLRHWKTDTLVIPTDELGVLILAAVLGGIGFGAGYPLGVLLRRSGAVHWAPGCLSLSTVLLACVAGEFLFISLLVCRQAGVVDLSFAMHVFVPFVAGYHPSWLILKFIVMGAIAAGCYVAVRARKKVQIHL